MWEDFPKYLKISIYLNFVVIWYYWYHQSDYFLDSVNVDSIIILNNSFVLSNYFMLQFLLSFYIFQYLEKILYYYMIYLYIELQDTRIKKIPILENLMIKFNWNSSSK